MATKKKVSKKVQKPTKPVLEGWKLKYAKRLKWNVKTQFMALEFIIVSLELNGKDDEDVTYARDILSNLQRPE